MHEVSLYGRPLHPPRRIRIWGLLQGLITCTPDPRNWGAGVQDPSFRALSGRLKFTVRRHKFNTDSLRLCHCCAPRQTMQGSNVDAFSQLSAGGARVLPLVVLFDGGLRLHPSPRSRNEVRKRADAAGPGARQKPSIDMSQKPSIDLSAPTALC